MTMIVECPHCGGIDISKSYCVVIGPEEKTCFCNQNIKDGGKK